MIQMVRRDFEICTRLRDNNPDLSKIEILDLDNRKARHYGEGLQYNSVVEILEIRHDHLILPDHEEDMKTLVEFIAKSQHLKVFALIDFDNVDVVALFLKAVQESSSIEEIKLKNLPLPQVSFTNLLSAMKSLKRLGLWSTRIISDTDEIETENLIAAPFHRNVSLLEPSSETNVNRFASKSYHANEIATEHLIAESFRRNNSLIEFEINDNPFATTMFHFFAKGLQQSQTLEKLQLAWCQFDDRSTKLLIDMFQFPQLKIEILQISYDTNFPEGASTVLSQILHCRPATSKLREFQVDCFNASFDIRLLLHSLEKDSSLESLQLLKINRLSSLNELISKLHRVRGLKRLKLDLYHSVSENHYNQIRESLCFAIQQNMCLKETVIQNLDQPPSYTDKLNYDQSRIQSYCCRNNWIQNWSNTSQPLPSKYVSQVMVVSLQYELWHEVIYKLLVRLSGEHQ